MEAGVRATDAYCYDYIETAIGTLYAAKFGVEPQAATA
jgi:nitrogen fixation protein NifB